MTKEELKERQAKVFSEITKGLFDGSFECGYKKAEEDFEANRLAACEAQTEEERKREENFVQDFIQKNHRTPTFSDCIEITLNAAWDEVFHFLASRFKQYPDGELEPVFKEMDFDYIKKKIFSIYDKEEEE
jgi:hypothetical protein